MPAGLGLFRHFPGRGQSAIVFTDLDATLLEPDGSLLSEAASLVRRLAQAEVSVVPVTSKTRLEVSDWLRRLRIPGPAIFENGARTVLGETVEISPSAVACASLLELLWHCSRETGVPVRPLTEMSEDELERLTGLSPREQAGARSREYTLPFLAETDDLAPLRRSLQSTGRVAIVKGGRFWHLMGLHSKADFFARVRGHCGAWGTTLGLGDAPNDIPILAAVDRPAIIRGEAGHAPELVERFPAAYRTAERAGAGWVEAISELVPPELSGRLGGRGVSGSE